jgi:hypothetical protein
MKHLNCRILTTPIVTALLGRTPAQAKKGAKGQRPSTDTCLLAHLGEFSGSTSHQNSNQRNDGHFHT